MNMERGCAPPLVCGEGPNSGGCVCSLQNTAVQSLPPQIHLLLG